MDRARPITALFVVLAGCGAPNDPDIAPELRDIDRSDRSTDAELEERLVVPPINVRDNHELLPNDAVAVTAEGFGFLFVASTCEEARLLVDVRGDPSLVRVYRGSESSFLGIRAGRTVRAELTAEDVLDPGAESASASRTFETNGRADEGASTMFAVVRPLSQGGRTYATFAVQRVGGCGCYARVDDDPGSNDSCSSARHELVGTVSATDRDDYVRAEIPAVLRGRPFTLRAVTEGASFAPVRLAAFRDEADCLADRVAQRSRGARVAGLRIAPSSDTHVFLRVAIDTAIQCRAEYSLEFAPTP